MKRVVHVPALKEPIQPSPGFQKKALSTYKLDLMALCQFGCLYCSSNWGYYLRTHRKPFARLTLEQHPEILDGLAEAQQEQVKEYDFSGVTAEEEERIKYHILPDRNPGLMFVWDAVLDNLKTQLSHKPASWGEGHTLVFSMLTDSFSPELEKEGVTEQALRLLLERTRFRIRVLTKSAVVGKPKWVQFFQAFPDRFVVGLSLGSLDDAWAQKVEIATSRPTARLQALHTLQDAGIPTYGMLCPIFPDGLQHDRVERLVQAIRPERVEHLWAEPYNDRNNYAVVRDAYPPGSAEYDWMTEVYVKKRWGLWSAYAVELYARLWAFPAVRPKLRYLLYEDDIGEAEAARLGGLAGVLLQSKPDAQGYSQNPHIRRQQQRLASGASPGRLR